MTPVWRQLASQSLVIFGARLTGAGIVFVTQALIARRWGAPVLGDYLFVVAAVNVTATAMPLGFQVVGSYFAADYRAHGAGHSLRAFMRRAYGHAAAVALGLFIIGSTAVHMFAGGSATVRGLWPPSLLMAIATAAVYVNGALLVGLKRPVAGLIADTLFRPMLALFGFALAATVFKGELPLRPMLWIAAAGYLAVAAIQTSIVLAATRRIPGGAPAKPGESRRWWRYALPWVVISLVTDFFFDIDLMLVAGALSRDELAIFGVCARVCSLLAFGIATVYAVTMPDILEAGARRNEAEFHRRIGDANLIAAALAAALAIGMFATGPILGLMFGKAFAVGGVPLGILSLGLVVRAVLGPASLVLSFYDRPHASLPSAAIGLAVLVIGNSILVPTFGLNGAAGAALIAMTAWSAALWLTARRDVQMDVSILPRLKDILTRLRAA